MSGYPRHRDARRSIWGWSHACALDVGEMIERKMGADLVWVHDAHSRRWVKCVWCGQRLDTWITA